MTKIVKSIFILILFNIGISCNTNSSIDYLKKVLENLEKIESAAYLNQVESWIPGDTIPQGVNCRFEQEFNNAADTTIGASYVSFDCDEPTKLDFAYDGKIRAITYHELKEIVVDDFTARPLPFRPISPPFFNYVKNIIKYALTTKDSITFELKEFKEYFYFKLVIHEDKNVEFFGKAYYIPENLHTTETTSIYELWINKSNNLPYKSRREMSHDISVNTISNVELNRLSISDFNIYEYFPVDYKIKNYGKNNREHKEFNLIGKKAPVWILKDKNEQSVSISDFKGKILLLQLTGIGCGACYESIPFLKEIKEKYSEEKFELVAIETWVRKPYFLQNYSNRNELNYNLLCGTEEIVKDYQTGGVVPVFFILDREQIIRKVFHGYSVDSIRKEIIDAINELL